QHSHPRPSNSEDRAGHGPRPARRAPRGGRGASWLCLHAEGSPSHRRSPGTSRLPMRDRSRPHRERNPKAMMWTATAQHYDRARAARPELFEAAERAGQVTRHESVLVSVDAIASALIVEVIRTAEREWREWEKALTDAGFLKDFVARQIGKALEIPRPPQ